MMIAMFTLAGAIELRCISLPRPPYVRAGDLNEGLSVLAKEARTRTVVTNKSGLNDVRS